MTIENKREKDFWSEMGRYLPRSPEVKARCESSERSTSAGPKRPMKHYGRESREPVRVVEDWQFDAHWTAITTYLAELYFPREG